MLASEFHRGFCWHYSLTLVTTSKEDRNTIICKIKTFVAKVTQFVQHKTESQSLQLPIVCHQNDS